MAIEQHDIVDNSSAADRRLRDAERDDCTGDPHERVPTDSPLDPPRIPASLAEPNREFGIGPAALNLNYHEFANLPDSGIQDRNVGLTPAVALKAEDILGPALVFLGATYQFSNGPVMQSDPDRPSHCTTPAT